MENINHLKLILMTIIGAGGSFIANLLGGWTNDLVTLISFYGYRLRQPGLVVAGVFKASPKTDTGALESRAGWKGLCRKGMTLLVVLVATRLDMAIGVTYIRTAVIIGFMANELISIVENAGLMGLPIPSDYHKGN